VVSLIVVFPQAFPDFPLLMKKVFGLVLMLTVVKLLQLLFLAMLPKLSTYH